MSPFLTEPAVRRFGNGSGADVLISRPPALDGVGMNAVAGYSETYVVDSAEELPPPVLDDEAEDTPESETADDLEIEPPRPEANSLVCTRRCL